MPFQQSSKVVCIDDTANPDFWCPEGHVQKGRVYCVQYAVNGGVNLVGCPVYEIKGDVASPKFRPMLTTWAAGRFRLLADVQAENRAIQQFRNLRENIE